MQRTTEEHSEPEAESLPSLCCKGIARKRAMPRNTKGHQTRTPVPGGSICARQHHTDTAARYRKVSGLHFVIFGIVYIWLNEQHRRQELEITSQNGQSAQPVQVQLSQRTYRQRLPAAG